MIPDQYIYNETDNKYYQKLVAYGDPVEINDIDLNSEWISDSEDDEYNYFKSNSNVGVSSSYSQCKVTWSNLTSITFKYMSNSDMSILFVLKLDSEKFTLQSSDDDIYLTTEGKTPGTYNEFTIDCDEGEHHIWFGYVKATDEDCGFIGVPKSVSPVLDVKQGAELPAEYKFGGISAENNKTYNINFKNVILPNGSNIVLSYEDYTKTEKTINYEYVDLGLSVKWAKYNIGASSETDYGVYFQWGETSGVSETLLGKYSDENYSWSTYKHCNGTENSLKKYTFTDGKITLDPEDDAATQIMGDGWRMPTEAEFQELLDNTIKEWIQVNGVNGMKFTSKKEGYQNNSIFIPASGECRDSLSIGGDSGYVWSSSHHYPNGYDDDAWKLLFYESNSYMELDFDGRDTTSRRCGYVIRGVRN